MMQKYLLPKSISKGTINEILDASRNFYLISGSKDAYEILMTDQEKKKIIQKIRNGDCYSKRDFDKTVGKFLNNWKSHYRYCCTSKIIPILKKIVKIIQKDFYGISLEKIKDKHITSVHDLFKRIIDIKYINTTNASKVLSVIKPETFIMWDRGIAEEYGCAQNSQGYCRFIQTMRDTVIKIREIEPKLDKRIENMRRSWTPPIAKVLDEWNIMTKK